MEKILWCFENNQIKNKLLIKYLWNDRLLLIKLLIISYIRNIPDALHSENFIWKNFSSWKNG